MSSRAVVLLSGGQDSTTCLYWAKQRWDELYCASIFYGQRHASELAAATDIAKLAGAVSLTHFDLPVLQTLGDSALVDRTKELTADGGREDRHASGGLPTSFVPGRNAMFLTVAAAYAVKVGAKDIVTGVCETDYSGYPDCRQVFIDAMAKALTRAMPSSAGPIRIHTPLMHLSKSETVKLARELPGCWDALALSVTCYEGSRCGECPACVLRAKGFAEAGYEDPACAST